MIWDYWAVGMIILEILVGTQTVMCIDTHAKARQILEDYEPYMEPQLMTLLEFLILSKDPVNFGDYIEWVLDQDQDLVSKCITSLWDA